MTADRHIPAGEYEVEIKVSNSTFIASAAPAASVEAAREFIHTVRAKYPDATHHVPAFIIGHPPSVIEHSSDDGEPSGTAGKPALAVLRGSGIGDIVVVVTRYFGGTKLGSGGLVRAYGDAIRELITEMPIAEKATTLITKFTVPYPIYEQVSNLIAEYNGEVLEQEFGVDVDLEIKFLEKDFDKFNRRLVELSHGKIAALIIEKIPDDIQPRKQ